MLIISYKPGYLGNSLIYFSHFIASAKEFGFQIINPAFYEYADFFTGTQKNSFYAFPNSVLNITLPRNLADFLSKLLAKIRMQLLESNFCSFRLKVIKGLNIHKHFILSDPDFTQTISKKVLIFPHGYFFRDPINLVKHKELIRNFFSLCPQYATWVQAMNKRARYSSDVLIGIHIRQGDYQKFANGQFFYSIRDYTASMKSIEKLFIGKRVNFLVCSDAFLDKNMFTGISCIFSNGNAVEDMYALSNCDYIAGPPSSFSAWAAFYGDVPLYIMWKPQPPSSLKHFIKYEVPPV